MIKQFLEGRHPNASGKTIGEIYGYTDQQIETDHTFIQWLFPTDEPSRSVPNSPVLKPNDVVLIKESEVAQANLKKICRLVFRFSHQKQSLGQKI